MPKLLLPSSKKEIFLHIIYAKEIKTTKRKKEIERTTTSVKLYLDKENYIEAKCICNPCDNFCKVIGRMIAGKRLLEKIKDLFDEDDRRFIFNKIVPKLPDKKVFKSCLN